MLDVVELVEISIGVTSSLLTMEIIGAINVLLRLLVPVCIATNISENKRENHKQSSKLLTKPKNAHNYRICESHTIYLLFKRARLGCY